MPPPRSVGSCRAREDAYEAFAALHEAGVLLPDDDDRLRGALERNARILAAARAEFPQALEEASQRRERDVAIRIAELVDARLFVAAAGDEVWARRWLRWQMSLWACGGAHGRGSPVRDAPV